VPRRAAPRRRPLACPDWAAAAARGVAAAHGTALDAQALPAAPAALNGLHPSMALCAPPLAPRAPHLHFVPSTH
jgi:hypothetical protein